ncbi:TraB/GumN family protein [Candidatus Woesearchaeota archaeon]|nr:TraB/GumN family protein [Candidatus Woesearchaeota archaeon]
MVVNDIFTKSPRQRRLPFVRQLDYKGIKSYLVGTNHCSPNCFNDDIEKRLKNVEQLVVECALSSAEEAGDYTDKMHKNSSSCKSLFDLLDKDEQEALEKIARVPLLVMKEMPSLGLVPYLLFENAHPYFESVDQIFHNVADKKKIPVYGLETTDEQIIAVKDAGDSIQALRHVLSLDKKYGSLRAWIQKTGEVYVRGDADKLRKFTSSDSLMPSEDKFIARRNQRLAERSIPYLTKPSLVAVGVGHCILEPSMQTLYKQRGIKVKLVE